MEYKVGQSLKCLKDLWMEGFEYRAFRRNKIYKILRIGENSIILKNDKNSGHTIIINDGEWIDFFSKNTRKEKLTRILNER